MNMVNKVIPSLCVLMVSFLSAMDEAPKPLEESPMSLASSSFSSFIPKLPSFGEMSERVVSSWDSVASTVLNHVSDEAAFKKLGWPPHDPFAQQALIRSTTVYHRVNQSLAQKLLAYEGFEQDYLFIDRRYDYCQRVLRVLESHPDAAQLALHCITHHKQVLRPFDVARLTLFIQLNKEKSEKTAQDLERISDDWYDSGKY